MTDSTRDREQRRCAWCGRRLAPSPGPGRPRRYCRPSHRQRAYESRKMARAHALDAGQALVATDRLEAVRDLLYRIESAMDDVDHDLASEPAGVGDALWHLYSACAEARTFTIEPLALGRDR